MMIKSIKHGATAFGALSGTKGGNLEQGLSHLLEFNDFLLHLCQLRRRALFDLLARGLCVHTQREQFPNLFKRETKLLCAFNKMDLFYHFFSILTVARGPARRLLQQPFTLIEANGFHTDARETRNLSN